MNRLLAFLSCLVFFGVVGAFAADDYKEAADLRAAVDSWKVGKSIPSKLVDFHKSWDVGSWFPNPRGTGVIFGSITNYALLWRISLLPDVHWKFNAKYETTFKDKTLDGKIIKGKRSRIGSLGNFVLPSNGNPMFSYRENWMPKSHMKKLFQAKAGDILILFDKKDLSRFPDLAKSETGERYVLHRVREAYIGQ